MAGDLRVALGSLLILAGGFLFLSGLLDVVLVFAAPEQQTTLRSGFVQLAVGALLLAPPLLYGFRSLREGVRARRRSAE